MTFLDPSVFKHLALVVRGRDPMVRFNLFFALSILVAGVAQGFTRAQFVGTTGVIRVLAKDYAGVTDTDGQQLFEAMNVPPRDSIIGPGKAFETPDKRLRFICAQRSQVGTECSIFIHNSAPGLVDPSRRIMQYKVTGTLAAELSKLFHRDTQGVYYFVSVEGTLKVDIQPGSFEVLYSENSRSSVIQEGGSQKGEALVIVNVEDTLKITHVRNFWDSLNYAQDPRRQYLGMNAVLNQLAEENPQMRFVYLTQSPALSAGKAEEEFLKNNAFPQGETKTYSSNADKASRLDVLRSVIFEAQSQGPLQRVLLISHNGSSDVEAFHELTKDFQNLDFLSYLHVIYSSASHVEPGAWLFPEQTGFVTSMELLLDWEQKGLVGFSSLTRLALSLVPQILDDKASLTEGAELALPRFVSCEDFRWQWSTEGKYQFLKPLRDFLRVRCQKAISPLTRQP